MRIKAFAIGAIVCLAVMDMTLLFFGPSKPFIYLSLIAIPALSWGGATGLWKIYRGTAEGDGRAPPGLGWAGLALTVLGVAILFVRSPDLIRKFMSP